jgi:hypothetical protein
MKQSPSWKANWFLASQEISLILWNLKVHYRIYKCPVIVAWHVLRLRIEEWPPLRRVASNITNKQLRTADKGWSSGLGVERGANNSSQ